MFSFKLKAAIVGYLVGASVLGFQVPRTARAAEALAAGVEVRIGDRAFHVAQADLDAQARDVYAGAEMLFASAGGATAGIDTYTHAGALRLGGNVAAFRLGTVERGADGRVARVVLEDRDGSLGRLLGGEGDAKVLVIILIIIIILVSTQTASLAAGSSGSSGGIGSGSVPVGAAAGPLFTLP